MLLITTIAFAAAPTWQIIPKESSLTFTGTQNGAPVSGQFKKFTGDIHFDPDHLDASSVIIYVDIASISDPSNQLADTLITSDWFDTKLFPQAIFKTNDIKKTGDKTFEAEGTLTIRDKTLPVSLHFTEEEYTQTRARIKGSTVVKRLAFGVGQGEWADTSTISDEVTVNFVITAVKKSQN